ncbi:MAG TPA: GNAT family N-acetyltransferase [Candidatus Methanomethylophilaceae archaeon]|nr:GNAT family N-acetyltransferase [Candidatus Methanomethylophilaceae archaeon]
MEIRKLKLKDLEKVRELEISCIKEYFAETIENKWNDLPEEWKENLGASSKKHFGAYLKSGLSFVAIEDDEVVGFVFAQMLHNIANAENLLWIENLAVHPYLRRNLIAYRILRECIKEGIAQGAEVAHSMIQPDNIPSLLLHKKIGFFIDPREVALMDLKDPELKL